MPSTRPASGGKPPRIGDAEAIGIDGALVR
jgi:hypothetical protein